MACYIQLMNKYYMSEASRHGIIRFIEKLWSEGSEGGRNKCLTNKTPNL